MNPAWLLALMAALLQLLLALMLAASYSRLAHTPVGKYMVFLALLFLGQGLVATVSYAWWAHQGYDHELALPLAAISLMSLAGLTLLYRISRM